MSKFLAPSSMSNRNHDITLEIELEHDPGHSQQTELLAWKSRASFNIDRRSCQSSAIIMIAITLAENRVRVCHRLEMSRALFLLSTCFILVHRIDSRVHRSPSESRTVTQHDCLLFPMYPPIDKMLELGRPQGRIRPCDILERSLTCEQRTLIGAM
jgi:hypothetical protein